MWNKIYPLILENKNCAALDIMFYEIDSLCLAGKFSDVDTIKYNINDRIIMYYQMCHRGS